MGYGDILKMDSISDTLSTSSDQNTHESDSTSSFRPSLPDAKNSQAVSSNDKMEQLYVDTQSPNQSTFDTQKDGNGHFFLAAPKIHQLIELIDQEVLNCKTNLKEEVARRQKYVIDQKRRSHDYQLFIQKYFAYALKYGLIDIEKTSGVYKIKHRNSGSGGGSCESGSDSSVAKSDTNNSKSKEKDHNSSSKSQNANSSVITTASEKSALINGSLTVITSTSSVTANAGEPINSATSKHASAKSASVVSDTTSVTASTALSVTTCSNGAHPVGGIIRAATSSPLLSENRRKSKVPKRR